MQYRPAAAAVIFLMALACLVTPGVAQVTSVTVVEKAGVTTANYPVTISMIFKQGDVASHVTAVVGGQNLTTQTDVKVRWPDNSVKHALVSFVIPSVPANGSVTVSFNSGGTNANSSYTTKAQLLATDFDARMTITPSGGTATSITARNLLSGIANPEYWIQGQVCSEFLIRDFSQNISNQLNVQYYVRYYPGWNGFRVDAVVENCWTEYRGNLTYDFNLLLGNSNPQSVFSKTAFTHTYNARWHKVFWQGNTPPTVEVRYNLAYLTSTKVLPNYDTSLVVPAATIASEYTNWQASPHDIMQHGIINTYFPTTGGRQEIGIYPTWAARYLLSMDNRMKEITLSRGDVSGSIPIHLREGNPAKSAKNHVMTIDDRPTVWASWWDYTYQDPADKLPAPVGTCTSEWTEDNAHQASFACIPYLVTGDFYYLEEMYFWGSWDLADGNAAYRSNAQGLLNDQTRGDAWAIRNISDAAGMAPDTQTLEKSYFTNKTNNNINNWVNRYITTGNYPSVHYWQDQSNIGLDGGRPDSDLVTTCRYYTSPWMDDFVLVVLSHMKDVGWNTSSLIDWLGASLVNRFHHPDYNWYRGAPYHIPTAYNDGNNNGIRYATWLDVNNAYVAQPGPTDFPNPDYVQSYNFIARAAMSGVTHLTSGQATYDWLDSHLYSKSGLNDDPTWGLLPRGYTPPSDTTAPAAVSNLAAGTPTSTSLTLTWTAPGDDGSTGTATTYDIRYSTSTIDGTNWASATQVTGEPTPAVAGTNQSMTVSSLNASTTYYFAMKTSDEVPNTSALSNVASGATSAVSGVLQVGPGKTYSTVQAAVTAAADGSTIEIYSSTYTQSAGWASIGKNNLTLRGMGSPRPVLDASGSCLSGKAIFIISGTGTTVENLEFKNCRNTTDLNAAGIRQEGANLTVRNCYFHDNDNGLLVNAITGSTVLVETSEFYHNGYGDGGSHNVYCNAVDSFTLRYCWSHNASAGHEVKTRAKVNYILYNRIGNEGGTGSYEIDLPNGGTTYIIGNQMEQSATTGNPTIISYGAEGATNPDQHLYVVNNTIVNNRSSGTFVYNYSTTSALLENNIFQGNGTVLTGPGTQTTNWATANASLADPAAYDFHLTAGSAGAINAGTTPGSGINGFNMNPALQYSHPCGSQARPSSGTIDIGGYEYVSGTPSVQFAATSSSGSEATSPANLTVTLSASSSQTVTVDYNVTGGTATQGADYTLPASGSVLVALKRDAGLLQGGALASQFTTLTAGNVTTVAVRDAIIAGGGIGAFMNYGTASLVSGYWGGPSCAFGWDVSAYAGGTVNKAELRIHCTMGNSAVWYAGIKTHDWAEGNKNGDYPGATPGICWNHPNGTYSGPSGPLGWGAASSTAFDETANTGDVYDHVNFTSTPGGDAFIVADVTSLVQDWLSSAKPNYGLYVNIGNHSLHLSEIGTDNEPVLFLDVTVPQRRVTFSPGQTSQTIPITILNDTAGEPAETIQLTLSNPVAATLGGNTVHTYTINDDDMPTVQFGQASSSGGEATTSVSIPVTLSASSASTVTVSYAVTGGTATGGGTDYTLAAGQLTFTSGVTSQNIPVTINNDTLNENDETIVITLSSPANAALGATTTHTYTILDNDAAPTVQFSAASSSGSEATTSVNLAVSLSAASGKTVTVNYAATGGTATGGGTDYSISGTSLTFSPGTTSQNVPVTVVNDTAPEGNETIIVTLSGPGNATLGANTTHTYTINDNDSLPSVQFSTTSSSGGEATTPANLTVTLSASSSNTVTVDYNVTGGTAAQGSDYTLPPGGNQVIALKRDTGLLQGGAIDSRFTSLTGANVVTATIKDGQVWGDGDATYQNFGARTQVPSGSGGAQGLIAFDLSAYAGGTVNKAQLRFKCTMGNNTMQWAAVKSHDWAEGNKDQNYPGVAPSAPGVTWANPSATNTSNSGPLGWGASSNAMLDTAGSGADLYAYADFISMPGGNAFVVADVTSAVQDWLSGTRPNYGLLIQTGNHDPYLSEAGTDNEPVLFLDVTLPQRQVTFNPGETSKTIPITIINDTAGEYSETIQVTLSSPGNATLGGNTVHTYTINDNDVLDCTPTAETPVYGTVTGAFSDLATSNNVYESIREVMNGTNYSWCEHKWTFSVRAGSGIQFRLEAYRPTNSDTDNFQFAYSANGTTWTNMVSVTKSSDDNTDQTYSLPAGTSGTVYVRVQDTNRTKNKNGLDSLYIDRMVIRSTP